MASRFREEKERVLATSDVAQGAPTHDVHDVRRAESVGLAALGHRAISTRSRSDLTAHRRSHMQRRRMRSSRRLRIGSAIRAARPTAAEAFLAEWTRSPRARTAEVTWGEWGYTYTATGSGCTRPRSKDLSLATLRRQLREPRAPRPTFARIKFTQHAGQRVLDDPAILESSTLRAGGLSIALGDGPGQARTIEHALEIGGFDAVKRHGTAETAAGAGSPRHARLAVIVKEALANGALCTRSDPAGHGCGLSRVHPDAVAWARTGQPWVTSFSRGHHTTELTSNSPHGHCIRTGLSTLRRSRRLVTYCRRGRVA